MLTASFARLKPVLELVDRLARLLAVVAGGVGVVLAQRLLRVALPAAQVVAGENLVVAAARAASAAAPPRAPCASGACA